MIRLASGRYASYWNAVLLVVIILHVTRETLRKNKGNLRCMATVKISGFNIMFGFTLKVAFTLRVLHDKVLRTFKSWTGSIPTSNNETKWKLLQRTKIPTNRKTRIYFK